MKKIIYLSIMVLILISLILIGGGCRQNKKPSASPSEAVDIYTKCTLGSISSCPDSDNPYSVAKQYLVSGLQEELNTPGFIPMSYCIQDGPSEVRIDSEKISNNIAEVIVSAKYGEWQKMWKFKLIIEQREWRIAEIICAPFPEIYANIEYGFSFEYPETWYLGENSPEVIYLCNIQEDLDQNFLNPKGVRTEIHVFDYEGASSLEQWISRSKLAQEPLNREEINIDGYRALQDEYSPINDSQGNLISVYIAGENHIIQLKYYGQKDNYYMQLSDFMRLVDNFKFD